MSNRLFIPVKESKKELQGLLKNAIPLLQPRIKMILVMQKAGEAGMSKRDLMDSIGVCSQSIQTWRTVYKNGGFDALLQHGRIGFKPSVFTKEEHFKIELKLKNPQNDLPGYKELQQWCNGEFKKEFLYNTVMKYAIKNFGSKIKVARKSHVKKEEELVNAFKKTSFRNVKK